MSRRKKAVREPIQVYLTEDDRELLDRAAKQSGMSRAEVLRRGLRQFGGAVVSESHPVIEFLEAMAASDWPTDMPDDIGRRHDAELATVHRAPATKTRGKRR